MTEIFQGREPHLTRWYRKRVDPRHGAPDDESGALLPVRVQLLAAPGASIVLGNLVAYSTGLEFMLFIRHDPALDPSWGGCDHYYEGDDPDQCLRFGLQFSDGSRVTRLTADAATRRRLHGSCSGRLGLAATRSAGGYTRSRLRAQSLSSWSGPSPRGIA